MKINPIKVFNDLKECIVDFYQKKIYLSIIKELTESGKLEKAGFRVDLKYNLYLGINLNPELLFYQDTSVETAELRMISEKLKTHTDKVPTNCVPKDVSLLLNGTTNVPKIPANMCTGIAPTTSSIPKLSNILVPKYIIKAPIEPITSAKPGVGVSGSAVIATRPAKAPLSIMMISVLPPISLVTTAPVTVPAAPAR